MFHCEIDQAGDGAVKAYGFAPSRRRWIRRLHQLEITERGDQVDRRRRGRAAPRPGLPSRRWPHRWHASQPGQHQSLSSLFLHPSACRRKPGWARLRGCHRSDWALPATKASQPHSARRAAISFTMWGVRALLPDACHGGQRLLPCNAAEILARLFHGGGKSRRIADIGAVGIVAPEVAGSLAVLVGDDDARAAGACNEAFGERFEAVEALVPADRPVTGVVGQVCDPGRLARVRGFMHIDLPAERRRQMGIVDIAEIAAAEPSGRQGHGRDAPVHMVRDMAGRDIIGRAVVRVLLSWREETSTSQNDMIVGFTGASRKSRRMTLPAPRWRAR